MSATLIQGDAAATMLAMPARSVDMIYVDPPFGNRQVWTGKAGSFDDRWKMGEVSVAGWEALRAHSPAGAAITDAFCQTEHDRGYLGFVAGLLLAGRHVLKLTGSLWIHFDDTFGAQIRILGGVVFGPTMELAHIIWKRAAAHSSSSKCLPRVHDTIAVFARSRAARWRMWRAAGDVSIGDACDKSWGLAGAFFEDRLGATSKERVGYPTQKPVALIRRFIASATVPGDVVLDPTCGSGTTLVAALGLGRRAIGIDASADAIKTARERLPREPEPAPVPIVTKPRQLDLFALEAA